MRRARFAVLIAAAALTAQPAFAAGSGGEKKKGGGASFIQFPLLTATVLRADGKRGVLTVESGIDVPDANLRTRAGQLQPRLRDAYVRFLQVYAAAVPPGAAPNADTIGGSLQRATDDVLGKPGAKLLLGTILVN